MAIMANAGLEVMATRVIANAPAAFTYGAMTETAITEAAGDTALAGEIVAAGDATLIRAAMTCTNPSAYVTQWAKVFTCAGTTGNKTIQGFAVFNAAGPPVAPTMLWEHLFSTAKGLAATETLTVTAQMTTQAA